MPFYHFASAADADTPEGQKIMADCSMINLITKDDVPVALACSFLGEEPKERGAYVHHPKHSTAIAEQPASKTASIVCWCFATRTPICATNMHRRSWHFCSKS